METNHTSLPQAEGTEPLSTGQLFWRVQHLYTAQFRQWFAITAPTSVLATVILVLGDQEIRAIARTIPKWTELQHPRELLEITILRFGGYFVAWFLGCFALAGIATIVCGLDSDDEDLPLRDSHQRARERIGALFSLAVVTFVAFLIGMAAAGIVESAIVKIVGWARFAPYSYTEALIGTVVVASVVSWVGMAIPLVLRGDMGVWAALKKSLEVADGNQGFLVLLVIESTVGSYVAWYAAGYALRFVPTPVRLWESYTWISLLVSALASAAVEPPLLIGLSVLADEGSRRTEPPPPSLGA